jgi:hypothetical protein
MKTYLFLFALMILSVCVRAQPPVKKTTSSKVLVNQKQVEVKKPGNKKVGALNPSAIYKTNPRIKNLLGGLPENKVRVGGTTITSKMISVDRPGLVSTKAVSKTGITQRHKDQGSSTENGQLCQTYSVKVSANSENFDVPYGTQAAHIYPGAAYMYDEYYKNTVSPKPLTWPRNPMYIQASSSSSNGKFELVESPTSITLNEAVGKIKNTLPVNATNENTSITMVSIYDEADFFLKVNGGGGGFGFKADATFGMSTESKKSYFLIDAVQTFFTLNATLPEGESPSFFQDATKDATKGALFMASVSYGRRVLGVLETEFKDEKMFASFKASYTAGFAGGYAGLDMINSMNSQTTKVKLYIVGGNAGSIEIPNATEASVRDHINKYLRVANSQSAVPIKFTFRDMAMSGMRYESATDNFTYKQCVPIAPDLVYDVKVNFDMIENSKQEEVKFGIKQYANLYVDNKLRVEQGKELQAFLCWMEINEPFKTLYKAEPPRNFTRNTRINKAKSMRLTQAEIINGNAHVELKTDYIAMYATKVLGSTNDSNPKKSENVYLKDVINSGGGSLAKEIQINFNGRVFTLRFLITATPV